MPKMSEEDFIKQAMQYAKQGDATSQRSLGYWYSKHAKSDSDYEKSFYWFNKASEQGDAEATSALGNLYFSGHGVPKDLEKALNLFEKGAKKGDASAQYFLGLYLETGNLDDNVPVQIHVLYNYNLSANQGHILAQFRLGEMHLYGTGVEKSFKVAAHWINLVRNYSAKDPDNSAAFQPTRDKAEKLWEEYKLSDYDF